MQEDTAVSLITDVLVFLIILELFLLFFVLVRDVFVDNSAARRPPNDHHE